MDAVLIAYFDSVSSPGWIDLVSIAALTATTTASMLMFDVMQTPQLRWAYYKTIQE